MSKTEARDKQYIATMSLRERRKSMGLVRVEVWIPEEDRSRVLTYVNKVRRERGIQL